MGFCVRTMMVAAIGLAAACSSGDGWSAFANRPGDPGAESVQIAVSLSGAVCEVVSATATVSAYDMPTIGPVPLQVADGTIQGTIAEVPAGSWRTVSVSAYDARGLVVYEGSTQVVVAPGQTVVAEVFLARTAVQCLVGSGAIAVTGRIEGQVFSFTDAALTSDGVVHFFDPHGDRLRRLDLATREFLPDISGSATLDAVSMAVAPDGSKAYLGYAGGRMDAVDLASGTLSFFAAAGGTVSTMVVAGDYLFTIDDSGAWNTQSLYHRPTRARTAYDDWRNSARAIVYSPARQTVYALDSLVSPTDLNMIPLDLAAGTLGAEVDSPYHGDYAIPNPLRLLPDQSGLLVGSGIIFDATDLTYRTSLGLSFVDVAFLDGRLYLVDAVGDMTQLRVLDGDFNILSADYLPGQPLRIFAHGGELVLVQAVDGQVQVSFVTP